MAEYISEFVTNLAAPSAVRQTPHQFAIGDNNAYTFTALVCNSANPEAGLLAGTVSGTALRPDGVTVVLDGTKGEATRQVNVNGVMLNATPCSVTLPQACFAYPGRVLIAVKLTSGTTATTVLALAGSVVRTETDTAVDPGEIIPDLATLQAAAQEALDAAAAATEAADHAVQYDAAQSLTTAQQAQARANIGGSLGIVSDEKRLRVTGTMKNEWLSGGAISPNGTHLMTEIIEVDSWMICAVDSGYQVAAFLYAAGTTNRASYSSITGWQSSYIALQPGERYSVAMQKSPSAAITLEDLKHLHIFYGYGRPGYTQTSALASVSSFASIRKPGAYCLAGGVDITSRNIADMPAGYVPGSNSVLYVDDYYYGGNHFFYQTLYQIGTPPTQWVRITKNDGTPWNPWSRVAYEKDINTSVLAGKKVSIYGDSISTYAGSIPSGNVTWYTGSNCGVSDVTDTWWKKVIDALGLSLLVNNSWSGRLVSSHADTWEGRTTNAAYKQANVDALASGSTTPEIILVFLGLNDFNNEAPLGNYDGTTTLPSDASTFTNAYAIMLDRIMTTYPLARVYCCTLTNDDHNPPSVFPEVNGNGEAMSTWNNAIRTLARAFGAEIIDFDQCGITHYNLETYIGDFGDYGIGDGVHPNAAGHSLMANQAIHQMDGSVKTRY